MILIYLIRNNILLILLNSILGISSKTFKKPINLFYIIKNYKEVKLKIEVS